MSAPVSLSQAELERYRGQGPGIPSGRYIRYFCPLHGGDNQRSLSLDAETGSFRCFNCQGWGYLAETVQTSLNDRSRTADGGVPQGAIRQKTPPLQPGAENIANIQRRRAAREAFLRACQSALPDSPGEAYLTRRGIPLALAQTYGLGYAPPGTWPGRYPSYERVVFPHTDLEGRLVNLYGRAVGRNERIPKEARHDHLLGDKGVFNAKALTGETVFVTEAGFDALSLVAAGYEGACAISGVSLRWDWVEAKVVVLCLDQDQAGDT